MQLEVTKDLRRVLNGCAATDVGQRVWVKIERSRGESVPVDAEETKFIRAWVQESIRTAEAMRKESRVNGVAAEVQILNDELAAMRNVQAYLPAVARSAASAMAEAS